MSEEFIMWYVPRRIVQLGFCNFHIRYRDMIITPGDAVVIPAYNELFFIVDSPTGVIVDSGYGIYDTSTVPLLATQQHEHRGEIVITNPSPDPSRIKFIQVILVN